MLRVILAQLTTRYCVSGRDAHLAGQSLSHRLMAVASRDSNCGPMDPYGRFGSSGVVSMVAPVYLTHASAASGPADAAPRADQWSARQQQAELGRSYG